MDLCTSSFVTLVRNEKLLRKFGLRVRTLRLERKLSQEALANDAGIPVNQIGRIERGEVNASLSTIDSIASALGINLRDLVDL